jgi:hypothetical protein
MYFFYIPRIYLKKVAELINRKDERSVRRWCNKNNLVIYKDSSGHFVYQNDFDLAYDLPIILSLKTQYGDDWSEFYEKYTSNMLHKSIVFKKTSNTEKYSPKSDAAQLIINKHFTKFK